MNHPIPIGRGIVGQRETVPSGDTITITFEEDAFLIYTQFPALPPAFLPLVPSGQFRSGDVINQRTAQPVSATTTIYYWLVDTGEAGSVLIEVVS